MSGYKSVDELTPDQLQELKGAMECDYVGKDADIPPDCLDDNGEITDSAVKAYYSGTMFTDDDFLCTAWGGEMAKVA